MSTGMEAAEKNTSEGMAWMEKSMNKGMKGMEVKMKNTSMYKQIDGEERRECWCTYYGRPKPKVALSDRWRMND